MPVVCGAAAGGDPASGSGTAAAHYTDGALTRAVEVEPMDAVPRWMAASGPRAPSCRCKRLSARWVKPLEQEFKKGKARLMVQTSSKMTKQALLYLLARPLAVRAHGNATDVLDDLCNFDVS